MGRALVPPTLCSGFSDDPAAGRRVHDSGDGCQDGAVATLGGSSQEGTIHSHLCSLEACEAQVWPGLRPSSWENFLDESQLQNGAGCSIDIRRAGRSRGLSGRLYLHPVRNMTAAICDGGRSIWNIVCANQTQKTTDPKGSSGKNLEPSVKEP